MPTRSLGVDVVSLVQWWLHAASPPNAVVTQQSVTTIRWAIELPVVLPEGCVVVQLRPSRSAM